MTDRTRIALCSVAAGIAVSLFGSPDARAGFCPTCVNSATVGDGIVFDELNTKGLRRPGGPKLESATLNGNPVQLKVEGHSLTAVGGGNTYANKQLVGLVMLLTMQDGRAYEVKLTEANACAYNERYKADNRKLKPLKPSDPGPDYCTSYPFWVGPEAQVPHFVFRVKKIRQRTIAGATPTVPAKPDCPKCDCSKVDCTKCCQRTPIEDRPIDRDFKEEICKAKYPEPQHDHYLKQWETIKHTAFAFEGDHYDVDNKRVRETVPAHGWFNLACAGTAVAKMHLLRHTRAGSITTGSTSAKRETKVHQRTAMLKAITGDYCGDGTSWTADGTPLQWTDSQGWFPRPPIGPPLDLPALAKQGLIEGVWGPDGAICLNNPRRRTNTPGLVYDQYKCTAPAVTRAEVAHECLAKGRLYRRYPTGPMSATSTTSVIPDCDEEWIRRWKTIKWAPFEPAPHVVTVRMYDDPAVYCDLP
jgi:hypothetical protein